MAPEITLRAVVLGAPDAPELAGFYQRLLGWEVVEEEPGWVRLRPPGPGSGLSFQAEPDHVPPVWPPRPGEQQMMLHLDLAVTDLDAAGEHARECGARVAPHQPQAGVLVFLDPAGHPFCLSLPDH